MKLLTTTLALILNSTLMFAQSFAYDTTTNLTMEGDAGGLFEATIHFLPQDSSDITFAWATLENTLSPNWSYSLCDYNNCYVNVPDSAKMFGLSMDDYNDNIFGFFKLLVSTDDSAAVGTLRLLLYDSANVTMADTIVFTLQTNEVIDTTDVTGITGLNDVDFQVYPNPTADFVSIIGHDLDAVEVVNLLGQTQAVPVSTKSGAILVNLESLPAGPYFILARRQGVVTSEKVVKK